MSSACVWHVRDPQVVEQGTIVARLLSLPQEFQTERRVDGGRLVERGLAKLFRGFADHLDADMSRIGFGVDRQLQVVPRTRAAQPIIQNPHGFDTTNPEQSCPPERTSLRHSGSQPVPR